MGLQCPVCCNMVCSIYGLWFHMIKQHPNQSTSQCTVRCPVCHTVFKGVQKLDSHIRACHLTVDPSNDLSSSDKDDKPASDVIKKSVSASKSLSALSVSSQEMLLQLDFSCDKFALVAQISAEHVPFRRATKASATCRSCDRSFPCAAALDLHVMNLHNEAEYAMACTVCSLCFVSCAQRDEHMMLTHDAPQVVLEFVKTSEDSDPRVGKVTREEFLLLFGLKALPVSDDVKDEDIATPKLTSKITDVDANQNLLQTADLPAAATSAAVNLSTPLVVGSLMALTAPVSPMFSSIVQVPGILPHNFSLASSQPVRFSTTSNAVPLLGAGAASMQSLAAMAGTFPFLPSFVPTASLDMQSPGVASSVVKNCSRDASLMTSAGTAGADGGTKSGNGSDAEDSNKTSMYCST